MPLWVPLGLLLPCWDGKEEALLDFEREMLLGRDKPAPETETADPLPRDEREAQIVALLQEGPLPSGKLAAGVGLKPNSVRRLANRMVKQGQLERRKGWRGGNWYSLAEAA